MKTGIAIVGVFAVLATAAVAHPSARGRDASRSTVCTIAAPPSEATVEARIPYAADFCELLSQGLAGDVFRAALLVTPGHLWHYPGSALSCRLHFRRTGSLAIRNSIATCRWLANHAAGWSFVNPAGG